MCATPAVPWQRPWYAILPRVEARCAVARAARVHEGSWAALPARWRAAATPGSPWHQPWVETRGAIPGRIDELVPPLIAEALRHGLPVLDRRWQGRFLRAATLVGPEARGSAPVRIVRDPRTRETPGIVGLYPVGEGAGYAGGIVSAAVDGVRSAKAIVGRYAPLDRQR